MIECILTADDMDDVIDIVATIPLAAHAE